MYTGVYAALSGSMAQEKRLAILTNNLANIETAGFKGDTPIFQVVPLPDVIGPVAVPGSRGAVMASLDRLRGYDSPHSDLAVISTNFSQGTIRETGNPLDVALEGRGFFVIQGANNTPAYTRQGTFTLNAEGTLVTLGGLPVQGQQGNIQIPRGSTIRIDSKGEVQVDGNVVDRLTLADFPDLRVLEKTGDTAFRLTDPNVQAQEASDVQVRQGAIELSNADPLRVMVSILETSRAYEAYQRVLQTFDDVSGRSVNDIARTA